MALLLFLLRRKAVEDLLQRSLAEGILSDGQGFAIILNEFRYKE